MKITNKLMMALMAVLLLCITQSSTAAILVTWGTATGVTLRDNLNVILHGNSFSDGYLSGGFVQLIWTGGDGLVSPFDATAASGINGSADDRVAATAWIGKDYFDAVDGGAANGIFSSESSVTVGTSLNSTFYMRVFNTVSSDYVSGNVPTSGYYVDITDSSWKISQGNIDTSTASFNVNSSYQTTMAVAVPEPSTVGLLLVGAGLLALRRVRRG